MEAQKPAPKSFSSLANLLYLMMGKANQCPSFYCRGKTSWNVFILLVSSERDGSYREIATRRFEMSADVMQGVNFLRSISTNKDFLA